MSRIPGALALAMIADLPAPYRDDQFAIAYLTAFGAELERVATLAANIRDRFVFPHLARDDIYGSLSFWERVLGLAVAPALVAEDQRINAVLAQYRKRRAASGASWVDLITQSIGTTAWSHQEGPASQTIVLTLSATGVPNEVTNPSFEVNTTGWASLAATGVTYNTFARQTGWASVGTASLRMTATKDATTTSRTFVAQTNTGTSGMPVTAGQNYSARAVCNVLDATAGGVVLRMEFYTAAGAFLSGVSSAVFGASTTGIVTPTLTAAAPATAAFATLKVQSTSIVSADVWDLYIDAVMFVQGESVPAYFDGDNGGVWLGTPHNSQSQLAPAYSLAQISELVREVTPAHLALSFASSGGTGDFVLGYSALGLATL